MFDSRHDEVGPRGLLLTNALRDAMKRQMVRLGSPAGEDDLRRPDGATEGSRDDATA